MWNWIENASAGNDASSFILSHPMPSAAYELNPVLPHF